ncbi:MAG TPA: hypothetical protein VJU87_01870 [Gemmatimonadaceae bacterium]|nr:hypothetical protein [Gemmatimonadaceae bacterium]
MRMSGWNDPADEERNPQRRQERRDTRDELEARLRDRLVFVSGAESDEEIVQMIDAVEQFEARVAALGGDSMVNTPDSSSPDDVRLVVPARSDDETARHYIDRVREAAQQLGA